jgi:hypothetical protein
MSLSTLLGLCFSDTPRKVNFKNFTRILKSDNESIIAAWLENDGCDYSRKRFVHDDDDSTETNDSA